jgi:hypothetical protein
MVRKFFGLQEQTRHARLILDLFTIAGRCKSQFWCPKVYGKAKFVIQICHKLFSVPHVYAWGKRAHFLDFGKPYLGLLRQVWEIACLLFNF